MGIKSISIVISFIFAIFCSTQVIAVPTVTYDANGNFSGISGLSLGTGTWDMALHDGTFNDILASSPNLPVYDIGFAHDSSVSLRNYITTSGILLPTDLNKWLGCGASSFQINDCIVGTAYSYNGSTFLSSGFSVSNQFLMTSNVSDGWTGLQDIYLYNLTMATWECTNNCTTVPEPATYALIGLGLAGLGFARMKKV